MPLPNYKLPWLPERFRCRRVVQVSPVEDVEEFRAQLQVDIVSLMRKHTAKAHLIRPDAALITIVARNKPPRFRTGRDRWLGPCGFGLRTRSFVGSMQWQFRSTSGRAVDSGNTDWRRCPGSSTESQVIVIRKGRRPESEVPLA